MANGNVARLIELDARVRKHIVVLGDAITDVYITGYTQECQDHCLKFVEQNRITVPGGALNAAQSLNDWRVDVFSLAQAGTIPTKTRFLANGSAILRHDCERVEDYEESREHARGVLLEFESDALLISDYCKGFLTRELIRYAIEGCVKRGVPCIVDAKRAPDVYDGAILKCNDAYATLYPEVLHREDTVITYGPVSPSVSGISVPGRYEQVPCVNHVGAGDCFAAHLTLALAHGFTLEDAADAAHMASRVYVQHPYNRPPLKAEILVNA